MKHRSTKPCSIEGCTEYQWARGYCARHYTRLKKSGGIATVRPRGTARERFLSHFTVNDKTGCWEWNGHTRRGYAIFWGDENKPMQASGFAYTTFVGPIPAGHYVLHKCDNPRCVNWQSHLFTGTQKDNMEDCSRKGRTAGQTGKVIRKVSPLMAMNIRIKYARGYSIDVLAEIYSTHTTTVNGIVKGLMHLRPS